MGDVHGGRENFGRSANEKALALRKVLHEPPSMDTLEEGSVDLKASFVALHDGNAKKRDAVRLSFKGGTGRRNIAVKTATRWCGNVKQGRSSAWMLWQCRTSSGGPSSR